jgi:hypothetical protein
MQKQVLQQLTIEGKVYPQGIHEFSEAAMKHDHFSFYVKAGYIVAPKAQPGKGLAFAEEALAVRKEMEEKYGVKRAKPAESLVPITSAPVQASKSKKG